MSLFTDDVIVYLENLREKLRDTVRYGQVRTTITEKATVSTKANSNQ